MIMENNKLGQEPAFPSGDPENLSWRPGMSKRFFAACMALQGMLSGNLRLNYDVLIKKAYFCADELLKQENETNP